MNREIYDRIRTTTTTVISNLHALAMSAGKAADRAGRCAAQPDDSAAREASRAAAVTGELVALVTSQLHQLESRVYSAQIAGGATENRAGEHAAGVHAAVSRLTGELDRHAAALRAALADRRWRELSGRCDDMEQLVRRAVTQIAVALQI